MQHRTDGILYACHPSYGAPHAASARQFWGRGVNPKGPYTNLLSEYHNYGSSLLADAFNVHWKDALNKQLYGQPITRFAMLHSDIIPQDFWLDVLLEELDSTGADLVAAVVPIKDGRGLSSTAIDDPQDKWDVYKRLTMREVDKLPETFSAEDAGFPDRYLLANTGCWVCDFTKPWRHMVHFEINSRLAFVLGADFPKRNLKAGDIVPAYTYDPEMKGNFINQVMSEDWNFSRQLGRLGGTVLCTRKVKLTHIGEFPYPNHDGSWGQWEVDECLRRKFDAASLKDIPDIQGWLTEKEGRALARLAKKRAVLEVGSYKGLSTVWMARAASCLVAVDTFDGRDTPTENCDGSVNTNAPLRDTYIDFMENIEKYQVKDVVSVVKGESRHALPEVHDFFDFAFIDGAHDPENLKTDLKLAKRTLRADGLIAFHDYGRALAYPHGVVTNFVDDLLQDGYEKVEQVDSLIVIKRKRHPDPVMLCQQ